MERRFFLQSEEGIHWRSAEGEILPSPGGSKAVLFTSFLKHGLSLPASQFLEGLSFLFPYKNLNPPFDPTVYLAHFCICALL